MYLVYRIEREPYKETLITICGLKKNANEKCFDFAMDDTSCDDNIRFEIQYKSSEDITRVLIAGGL